MTQLKWCISIGENGSNNEKPRQGRDRSPNIWMSPQPPANKNLRTPRQGH
ncbi:hypothetical protein [Coleofasciculus sp.]